MNSCLFQKILDSFTISLCDCCLDHTVVFLIIILLYYCIVLLMMLFLHSSGLCLGGKLGNNCEQIK
jgi:hypothetical protein